MILDKTIFLKALYRKALSFLRWIISATVLWVVLKFVDINNLIQVLKNLELSYILPALIMTVAVRLIMTIRWSTLLKSQGVFISWIRLLKIILITQSIGIFIPSSLGIDGLRALTLSQQTGKSAHACSSVLADRCAGIIALSTIAFLVSLIFFSDLNKLKYIIISGFAFSAGIILMVILIFYQNSIVMFCKKVATSNRWIFIKRASEIGVSLAELSKNRRSIVILLCYSFLSQLLRIILVFFLSSSLNINIAFVHFAIFLPLIRFLLMLPISIGGIGVQEAALLHFFGEFGMSIEQAVSLSILLYMDDLLWITIGIVVYIRQGLGLKRGNKNKMAHPSF